MKKLLAKLIPLAYGQYFNLSALFNKRATAKKAIEVFSTIRKGKVLPIQKDFLDSAKHKVEHINDLQIQTYRWEGSKGTVLLMHGWESNTFRWRNLIGLLTAQDFEVLAFDAPAHGYSTGKILHVPLYAHVTRHILDKYNPNYVVAHSMGGMTIHYTHYLNTESSVKKIVTIGAPSEFKQFMDHYQNLLKFNTTVRKAMNEHLKENFGYYIDEFSSTLFATKNSKKGLLFHDEEDVQVPVEDSEKVHEKWKGSELIITKGLGHSMHQKEVNEKIIEFIASP